MHRNDPHFDDPTYSAMSIAVKERDGRTQAKIELHGPDGTWPEPELRIGTRPIA